MIGSGFILGDHLLWCPIGGKPFWLRSSTGVKSLVAGPHAVTGPAAGAAAGGGQGVIDPPVGPVFFVFLFFFCFGLPSFILRTNNFTLDLYREVHTPSHRKYLLGSQLPTGDASITPKVTLTLTHTSYVCM